MSNKMRLLGAVIQGVVLGFLLSYAILNISHISSGVRLFRYQGF